MGVDPRLGVPKTAVRRSPPRRLHPIPVRQPVRGDAGRVGHDHDLGYFRRRLTRKSNESAAEQLPRLWSDLAGSDSSRAFAASWTFVTAGSDAVAFLRKRLVEERSLSDEQIGRLDSRNSTATTTSGANGPRAIADRGAGNHPAAGKGGRGNGLAGGDDSDPKAGSPADLRCGIRSLASCRVRVAADRDAAGQGLLPMLGEYSAEALAPCPAPKARSAPGGMSCVACRHGGAGQTCSAGEQHVYPARRDMPRYATHATRYCIVGSNRYS